LNTQFQKKYSLSGLHFRAHGKKGPANAGAFLTLIGLAVLFYSCFMYARRTFKLDSHAPSGYEDKFGPTVLGLALFAGLIVFLCLE
jgi:hypothetical protein